MFSSELKRQSAEAGDWQYVGGEELINFVAEQLTILQQGETRRENFWPVINFYGFRQAGKTSFLKEVARRAESGQWPEGGQIENPLVIGFDLATEAFVELSQEVLGEDREIEITEEMEEFVQRVSQETGPTLLLLDNFDSLSKKGSERFAKEIISPLIGKINTIIIITSKRPIWQWSQVDVNRNACQKRLELPQERLVGVEVESIPPELQKEIIAITGNYPPANKPVIQRLTSLSAEVTSELISEMKQDLAAAAKKGVWDLINEDIEQYAKDKETPTAAELKRAMECLPAGLSSFQIYTELMKFLREGNPELFRKQQDTYFLRELLGALIDLGFAYWDREDRRYCIDPILVHILGSGLDVS